MKIFLVYTAIAFGVVAATGYRHLPAKSKIIPLSLSLLLVIFLPWAQAVNSSRTTYPLVPWTMYASQNPGTTFSEYCIIDNTGEAYHYPFSNIAFSSPRAMIRRLENLSRSCRCDSGDNLTDSYIQSLVDIHRQITGKNILSFYIYSARAVPGSSEPASRTLNYTWDAEHTAPPISP